MDILAKKNMLYLLVFGVMLSLLAPVVIFADEGRINFFEEKRNYDETEKHSQYSKELVNSNPQLKKKTEDIEKTVRSKFTDTEKQLNNEIILFIDPDNRLSDGAVNNLVKFKKDFPNWNVKGVIITNASNLKKKLLRKQDYFGKGIEFNIDLSGSLAREFSVTKAPAYVITYQGRRYKIAGQPNLNETISKLDK